MKTANDIIEIFLNVNDKLKNALEVYELTIDDVGVLLYDEKNQQLQKIDYSEHNQPIQLWYSITNDKPYSLFVDFRDTEKFKKAAL